jgi:RecJ-like exonuclease
VKDSIKRLIGLAGSGKNPFEVGAVAQLSLDESHAERQQLAAAMAQVVVYKNFMPFFFQQSRNGTTDIPCTAGNQDLHKKAVLSETVWVNLSLQDETVPGRRRELAGGRC